MKIIQKNVATFITLVFLSSLSDLFAELPESLHTYSADIDATSVLSGESKAAALKIGFIDMNRFFIGYPATKRAEETLNAEKAKAKSELDRRIGKQTDKEVSEFRNRQEKILQDSFTQKRKIIIDELNIIIKEISDANGLNIVFDTSGLSIGQIPVIVYTNGVFDITEACIQRGKSPVKNQKKLKRD